MQVKSKGVGSPQNLTELAGEGLVHKCSRRVPEFNEVTSNRQFFEAILVVLP